jgi:hypothetical protein
MVLLTIYHFEMDCPEVYIELFELEVLSRDLTQVFTLTNKNRRKIKLK